MTPAQRAKSSEFIKKNALDWSIGWRDENQIDQAIENKIKFNKLIKECWHQCLDNIAVEFNYILVDGNDFDSYKNKKNEPIEHKTVVRGDSRFLSIAAASILAKHAHDKYILNLVAEYSELDDRYGISNNMGYGTPQHLRGIKKHGISQFHRRSFKKCIGEPVNPVNRISK
jgi:ribonuclease HII